MSYFSRLTDIVTCNLTQILSQQTDPHQALGQIVVEIEEGLAGARRSVTTATAASERMARELQEHAAQISAWTQRARGALRERNEERARQALARKQEIEDVVAGLEQQHKSAVATQEHLTTMLRALEARLAEARRKLVGFETGRGAELAAPGAEIESEFDNVVSTDEARARRLDQELEALKRELDAGA